MLCLSILIFAVETKSFAHDVNATTSYAQSWWSARNPKFPNYGGNDCANFASQALYAGGLPMEGGKWLATPTTSTSAWNNNVSLRSYLSSKGYGATKGYWTYSPVGGRRTAVDYTTGDGAISKGDLVFYDWNGDGKFDHVSVCTGTVNSGSADGITQHSTDRVNQVWHLGIYLSPSEKVTTRYDVFKMN